MHKAVQDTFVRFRASRQLLADAQAAAQASGMSLSEFARYSLRRQMEPITIQPQPPVVPCTPPPSPYMPNEALGSEVALHVEKAAKGDLESLRFLFHDRLRALGSMQAHAHGASIVAAEAVTLGRLVASHGQQSDQRHYVAALLLASGALDMTNSPQAAAFLRAESLMVLDRLASFGDDLAAASGDELMNRWPAAVTKLANDLRHKAAAKEAA